MILTYKGPLTSGPWNKELPKGTNLELSTSEYVMKGRISDKSFLQNVGTWLCDVVVVTEIMPKDVQPEASFQEMSEAVHKRKLLGYVTLEGGIFKLELEIISPPED